MSLQTLKYNKMILKSIKYISSKDLKGEWSIEGKPINDEYNQWLTFEPVNLIVEKTHQEKQKLFRLSGK